MPDSPRDPLEDNWTKCKRMARELDRDELIRNLLMQIASMRRPRERNVPLWSFVGEATSHGSGVSSAVCFIYGVDSTTGKVIEPVGANND